MIIVDTALQRRHEENNPIKVAMVGAGYMGRGIALQIEQYLKGMKLVAISNRTLSEAQKAYKDAGVDDVEKECAHLRTLIRNPRIDTCWSEFAPSENENSLLWPVRFLCLPTPRRPATKLAPR